MTVEVILGIFSREGNSLLCMRVLYCDYVGERVNILL
jgi:hypothetical protein